MPFRARAGEGDGVSGGEAAINSGEILAVAGGPKGNADCADATPKAAENSLF
jgi:hypothetical protein